MLSGYLGKPPDPAGSLFDFATALRLDLQIADLCV